MFTYPLFKTYYSEALDNILSEVLRSGAISNGSYVTQFEAGLAELLKEKLVVTLSDMSAAMYMALYLAGVRAGDEVATTAFTCMSSNSPIHAIGAKPLWIDIKPGSMHMDPADLKKSITGNTKAVILYHSAGYPAECEAIVQVCKEKNICLIEDCNNAMLASTSAGMCGSFADFSIYSFYPNRLINAIDGGLLVCRDEQHYLRAKNLRRFGVNQQTFRNSFGEIDPASDITEIGWAMNMPNIHCAIGQYQLDDLLNKVNKIRRNAALIDERLAGNEDVDLFNLKKGEQPAYWAYMLKVPYRDRLIKDLKAAGIHASSLHQRNDIYSGFAAKTRPLPETDNLQASILALPVGWWLDEKEISAMMDTFINVQMQITKEK